jgi:hypothetical protein
MIMIATVVRFVRVRPPAPLRGQGPGARQVGVRIKVEELPSFHVGPICCGSVAGTLLLVRASSSSSTLLPQPPVNVREDLLVRFHDDHPDPLVLLAFGGGFGFGAHPRARRVVSYDDEAEALVGILDSDDIHPSRPSSGPDWMMGGSGGLIL